MSESEPDEESIEGLSEGIQDSPQGDPRVLFVINLLLSGIFAYTVLWLSDLVGVTSLTLERFLLFTLILVVVTHVLTRR